MPQLTMTLSPAAAKVLAALLGEPLAVEVARSAAADLPEQSASDVARMAAALAAPPPDNAGSEEDLGDLTDVDVDERFEKGPGAPSTAERKAARYSRDAER